MALFYFNGVDEVSILPDTVSVKPYRISGMTVNVDAAKNKAVVICENGKRLEYRLIDGDPNRIENFPSLLAEFEANRVPVAR